MQENFLAPISKRYRRTAAHLAALLHLRLSKGPVEEVPLTPLGPLYSQRGSGYSPDPVHSHSRPHDEERQLHRMQGIIGRPSHPADYNYPLGMRGFPPPEWLLNQWRERWDAEDAQSMQQVGESSTP